MKPPINITFDSKDSNARRLLKQVGFNDEVVNLGVISPEVAEAAGVSFDALVCVANGANAKCLDEEYRDMFIDPAEAKLALKIFDQRTIARTFFSSRACPGKSGTSIQSIWANIMGRDLVSPMETTCRYDDKIGTELNRGIHFSDDLIPANIRAAGKAVVEILHITSDGYSGGSGVVVSSNGDLLTARHVLFNEEDGIFKQDMFIRIGEKRIPVSENQIILVDKENDFVHLRVGALTGRPFAGIASAQPRPKDIIWVVGFPGQHKEMVVDLGDLSDPNGEQSVTVTSHRTYTVGRVKEYGYSSDTSMVVITSALGSKGDSGGAIFDRLGRLIAITSGFAEDNTPEKKMSMIGFLSTTMLRHR